MKYQGDGISLKLGDLKVDSLDTNCGVFIGNNTAIGWSSHSKSNHGLGDAGEGGVRNSINIVFDNDAIDAQINDQDAFVCSQPETEAIANLLINFDKIDANSLNTNSSITIGQNSQSGWDSHSKTNAGSGIFHGNPVSSQNLNLIVDDDFVDCSINDQDIKPSFIARSP